MYTGFPGAQFKFKFKIQSSPPNHPFLQLSQGLKKVKVSRYPHAGAKGETTYSSYLFLTAALDGLSGRRHSKAALYPPERTPGIHWTGGWVGHRG
jgi:hypothetical protein